MLQNTINTVLCNSLIYLLGKKILFSNFVLIIVFNNLMKMRLNLQKINRLNR